MLQKILFKLHNNDLTLTEINLENAGVDDSGIKSLTQVLLKNLPITRKLKHINLAKNKLTDVGLDELLKILKLQNVKLKTINLSNNKICNEGAEKIMHAMRENTSIIEMDLNANDIKCRYGFFDGIIDFYSGVFGTVGLVGAIGSTGLLSLVTTIGGPLLLAVVGGVWWLRIKNVVDIKNGPAILKNIALYCKRNADPGFQDSVKIERYLTRVKENDPSIPKHEYYIFSTLFINVKFNNLLSKLLTRKCFFSKNIQVKIRGKEDYYDMPCNLVIELLIEELDVLKILLNEKKAIRIIDRIKNKIEISHNNDSVGEPLSQQEEEDFVSLLKSIQKINHAYFLQNMRSEHQEPELTDDVYIPAQWEDKKLQI